MALLARSWLLSPCSPPPAVWALCEARERAGSPRRPRTRGGVAADPHAGHDMSGHDGRRRRPCTWSRRWSARSASPWWRPSSRPVQRTIRTTGNVAYDETRLTTIAPKFAGFVERLHVDFTGQAVRRGQPLLEIYSPELVAAQEELLAALRMERSSGRARTRGGRAHGRAVDAARRRLLLWDISPAQVQQIERSGQVRRTLTLHAPFAASSREDGAGRAGGGDGDAALPAGGPLERLGRGRHLRAGPALRAPRRDGAGGDRGLPGRAVQGRVSYVYPEVRRRRAPRASASSSPTRAAASSRACTRPCSIERRSASAPCWCRATR
jgi:hypothetical protein